jgi:hypothetical protein
VEQGATAIILLGQRYNHKAALFIVMTISVWVLAEFGYVSDGCFPVLRMRKWVCYGKESADRFCFF